MTVQKALLFALANHACGSPTLLFKKVCFKGSLKRKSLLAMTVQKAMLFALMNRFLVHPLSYLLLFASRVG
jgi:hypothetical protein